MAKTAISLEEELTPEGQKMWDNLLAFEKQAVGISLLNLKRPKPLKLNLFEIELYFIRTELRKMIKNSQKVITECEVLIKACVTREEYLSCEARVAKFCHENLVVRLQKVLDGMPAYDFDIYIDDEEPRPYGKGVIKPLDKEIQDE